MIIFSHFQHPRLHLITSSMCLDHILIMLVYTYSPMLATLCRYANQPLVVSRFLLVHGSDNDCIVLKDIFDFSHLESSG